MKTMNRTAAAILALVLLAGAAWAGTIELGRPWAEPGDEIGLYNHATATIEYLDAYGADGKASEDERRVDETAFSGIFAWNRVWDSGKWMIMRGATNNRGDVNGSGVYSLEGSDPGVFRFALDYRTTDFYSDRTVERAYPMTDEPAALDVLPEMRWKRGVMKGLFRINEQLSLTMRFDDIRREGEKGSLARTSPALPALKDYETESLRATFGGDWRAAGLHGDLAVTFGKDDGTRTLDGALITEDDRVSTQLNGGVGWNASRTLTLLGRFGLGSVESKSTDNDETGDLENSSQTGVVAALWRPSAKMGLNLSGRVSKVDTDGWSGPEDDDLNSVDRERKSTALQAKLTWQAPARTRITAGYKHKVTQLDEILGTLDEIGATPDEVQVTDQERTTSVASLKLRKKFSPNFTLKLDGRMDKLEIEQTETGDRYWQGDRKRDTNSGSAAASIKLAKGLRMDLGGQMIRRTSERTDLDGLETTFDADRGTAVAVWMLGRRVTVLASASYGHEIYDLPEDAEAADGTAAILYDTTTWRFAPGVVLDLGGGLRAEGHWEGVRNRDSVENDYDRWYVRASYALSERMTLSGLFRKYEFDENRWDDYILDLYALSMSATF